MGKRRKARLTNLPYFGEYPGLSWHEVLSFLNRDPDSTPNFVRQLSGRAVESHTRLPGAHPFVVHHDVDREAVVLVMANGHLRRRSELMS